MGSSKDDCEVSTDRSSLVHGSDKDLTLAQVWEEFDDQDHPNFFSQVSIAPDGGFSEVGQLWYPMRWLTAIITLFFLGSNVYFILSSDVAVVLKNNPNSEVHRGFFLCEYFVGAVEGLYCKAASCEAEKEIDGGRIIAFLELCMTLIVTTYTFMMCIYAAVTTSQMKRWRTLEEIWWSLIPDLYTYSAMRLLHYVSPQVLAAEAVLAINSGEVLSILRFILFRIVCAIVGFDAFLMKCMENRQMFSTNSGSHVYRVWCSVLFLKQVLGIVQLGMFVRDRLFVFVFAGEDAVMQKPEVHRKNVWNAMLVRAIWRSFSVSKFVVIMLSFDDTDFQKLVLNEKATGGKPKSLTSSSDEDDDLE
mmetsp:Transcript_74161/g.168024  ORF Transcript_74161/g.168024 Transcript_74161/m.168024 type:complete len:360 (+) Transcript_74161:71-1150(+)